MLHEIIDEVRIWTEAVRGTYGANLKIEVLTDRSDSYRVIFDTENSMAELYIGEPDFAPYRYVSYEVAAVVEDKGACCVYWWYDDETCTLQDIIANLDKGIRFAMEY